MGKKIRVWDGTAWQDVSPSLPYTAIHSAQASMPLTGVDGQVWLDTDGTLAGQDFVPLSGGTMTGNLNTPSINSGGISGQNYFINGGMDIWQRGLDISTTSFAADRWYLDFVNPNYTAGISGRLARSTDSPSGFKYSASVYSTQDTGFALIAQPIEHLNAVQIAGKTVTFSFYIKRIAAITGGALSIRYDNGGASQDTFSGSLRDFNGIDLLTGLENLSTSWTRYSATFVVPSGATNGTRMGIYLRSIGNLTGTQEFVRITGVKLEIGSIATPFSRAGGDIQGELSACQRYYYRHSGNTYTPLSVGGYTQSTTDAAWWVPLPVSMRVVPTSIDYSGSGAIAFRSANNGSGYTVGSLTFSSSISTVNLGRGGATISTGTWTSFHAGYLEGNGGPCYIGFNAEL